MKIMSAIKNLFANTPTQSVKTFPKGLLSAMDAPGANFKSAAIPLSDRLAVGNSSAPVVETSEPVPAPIVAPVIAPSATPRCHACGQRLPEKIVEVVAVVDPDSERTDLPPRSRQEIARLIAGGETEEARTKRICNDKVRYAWTQGR